MHDIAFYGRTIFSFALFLILAIIIFMFYREVKKRNIVLWSELSKKLLIVAGLFLGAGITQNTVMFNESFHDLSFLIASMFYLGIAVVTIIIIRDLGEKMIAITGVKE